MLHGPFTLVRHHELEQQKSNIAVYIWQKLGLFSTFNCVQKFVAEEEQNVRFFFITRKLKKSKKHNSKDVSAVFIKTIQCISQARTEHLYYTKQLIFFNRERESSVLKMRRDDIVLLRKIFIVAFKQFAYYWNEIDKLVVVGEACPLSRWCSFHLSLATYSLISLILYLKLWKPGSLTSTLMETAGTSVEINRLHFFPLLPVPSIFPSTPSKVTAILKYWNIFVSHDSWEHITHISNTS